MADFIEIFADVTYASFGVDPTEFYRGKFDAGPNYVDYLADPADLFNIENSRFRFLGEHLNGGRVLDLGCGSGPYGPALKRHCKVAHLAGLDLDPSCARSARNVYDEAYSFNLEERLPFEDGWFDAVISIDLFGHIEFRVKDRLIQEVFRVTRDGGKSIHVIESGDLDYRQIDFSNPEDPLLKYVLLEGHVGIESPERVSERWRQYFEDVVVENAFIFPFAPIATYLCPSSFFRPELAGVLSSFTARERRAAQTVLGFVCDHLKEEARKIDPDLLMPVSSPCTEACATPAERLVQSVFRKPSGLVYLACRKPRGSADSVQSASKIGAVR